MQFPGECRKGCAYWSGMGPLRREAWTTSADHPAVLGVAMMAARHGAIAVSHVTGNMDRRCRQRLGAMLAKSSAAKRRKRNGGTTASRMRDVARKAGVSVMTVSRALNNPDKASKEMHRRVLAVVDEIGYVPNRLARSLSSNRSTVIGLIVPGIRNSLFAEAIKGISD